MLGSPCQGPRTGLTPPISTTCPAHPPRPPGSAAHGARRQAASVTPTSHRTSDRPVDYGERRDRLCPDAKERSFFITTRGTRLCHPTVYVPFRALLDQAGIRHQSPSRRIRIHDLRHSFAVKTLLGWYRDGDDVAARMPLLSTYLGHVDPAATYWYLSAAPELLALAAERLEQATGGRR
jgi:integrase/recombinase XerD